MTAAATPVSRYLAPLLVGLGAVLASWNWYLDPERVRSWTAALLLLACLALVLWFARRSSSYPAAPRQAADSIRNGVVFAALIMAVSLSVKLAQALGAVDDGGLSQRLTMVVLGVFFAFTGNALPKILTPLSRTQCDPASAQAVQRFAGWTWVLAGLAYAIAWLVFPSDVAMPVSLTLIVVSSLAVVARALKPRRARHKEA